jgi:hypothetical protein
LAPDLFQAFADEASKELKGLRRAKAAKFDGLWAEKETFNYRLRRLVDAIGELLAIGP